MFRIEKNPEEKKIVSDGIRKMSGMSFWEMNKFELSVVFSAIKNGPFFSKSKFIRAFEKLPEVQN